PVSNFLLPVFLNESSGLVCDGDSVWTHNDNSDNKLYRISKNDTAGMVAFPVTGVSNVDWEDMASDNNYFYVGDFGNNSNGARTDLRILRIEKQSLLAGAPIVDTIWFSYSDQVPVVPTGPNGTDFDCEAMVVTPDSILLFSKMWVTQKSTVYSLPKVPGTHLASRKFQLDVQGLVTDATLVDSLNVVVLIGYSSVLQPFLYLMYDYPDYDFLAGNRRKLSLNLSFHQVEGIGTSNGLIYHCTNERFTQSVITTEQKMHRLDLTAFLGPFVTTSVAPLDSLNAETLQVYPNPSNGVFQIRASDRRTISNSYQIRVIDFTGAVVFSDHSINSDGAFQLDLSSLSNGIYLLQLTSEGSERHSNKVVVQ
ncbi:MAG: T9SS type A sorting domain-containing protein, partial [Bacteroidota bacterium]